ncbi:MAG: serine hydrolase, partial [Kiritimatiellia bacterium]|nr:serine hydrolase [Kiritimatiellia bacterium]
GVAARAEMEKATPESQGVESRAILNWIDACEKKFDGEKEGRVHGFVIVRHGKTIAEGSWKPFDTLTKPHQLWSHSKSFTSSAVGFLVDEGKLDLDERLVDIFTNELPANVSTNLAQLRVRDCLTMNAGKAPHVFGNSSEPWTKLFFRQKFDHVPGTHFWYDSDATFMLAAIIERRTGKKLLDYLRGKMLSKIGICEATTGVSPEGIACGGWGMNMTTRELARFGQFYLQEGAWNGQELLSRDWVRLATSRQTWSGGIASHSKTIGSGSDWQQGYGFQFWRCRHNAFRADGASGQLTVVMPDQDAVVSVHAGLSDMQGELNLIWEHLLPAMRKEALPANPAAAAALEKRCATLAVPPVAGERLTDFRKFIGSYTIDPNPRGLRAIYLFQDAQTNMYVRLYSRSFPYCFRIGYNAWKEGNCHLDPEPFEGIGMLTGSPRTAASGAVQTNGHYAVRVYLPQTIYKIDLDFANSNGVRTVRGSFATTGGGAFTGHATDENPKPWSDVPVLDVSGNWAERRKSLLYQFTCAEFGQRPVERPADLAFETVSENLILGGKGVHRKVKISTKGVYEPCSFTADAYFPKDARNIGSFVSISLKGRLAGQKFNPDAEDPSVHSLPVSNVLARGYGIVTFTHDDIAKDDPATSFSSGVFKAFGPRADERKQKDWGALSAWAWGASRVLDWIETQPEFDAKRVAVIGHSRGGKASLWAGATDERFALTCVNCSGTGGAKLNRMTLPWSESLVAIQKGLPHFFCGYYPVFAESPKKMTCDQHQLLALVAPRRLSVGSGSDDAWAGPAGEKAATELAAPAWEAIGLKGLGDRVRYHVRKGPHDLAPFDWNEYMNALEETK